MTQNHLDRHHTFENYVNAKARLFETQGARRSRGAERRRSGHCDASQNERRRRPFGSAARTSNRGVARRRRDSAGGRSASERSRPAAARPAQLRKRDGGGVDGAIAPAPVCRKSQARQPPSLPSSIASNLSATSPASLITTIPKLPAWTPRSKRSMRFDGGLWIILGGKDKDSDYTVLREPLRAKARAALLIGAAAPKIARHLGDAVPVIPCGTLAGRHSIRHHARPLPAIRCCLHPPARVSISSRASSIAAASSRIW